MHRAKHRASRMPAPMQAAAARDEAPGRPTMPESALQNAEPIVNEPNAQSVRSVVIRARTLGDGLVCVAVLQAGMTAIHAEHQRGVDEWAGTRERGDQHRAAEDDTAARPTGARPAGATAGAASAASAARRPAVPR